MRRTILSFMLFLTMNGTLSAQEFKVPRIFSDHMVLQREVPVRLWGWDRANEKITISMDDVVISTVTDAEGRWEAYLPKQNAGGAHTITIKGSGEKKLNDVYFGDVWIAGGQSNMEWVVGSNIDHMDAEIADSNYPEIRFFKVARKLSVVPLEDFDSGEWKEANPEHVKNFSAVAWFFAKRNHLEKGVPVGIIDDNWGGTTAESWVPTNRLISVKGYEEAAYTFNNPETDWPTLFAENDRNNVVKFQQVEDTQEFLKYGAHLFEYDDSSWEEIRLPNNESMQDFIYLRKSFTLDNLADAKLSFGHDGKWTVVFINGTQVHSKIWSNDPKVLDIDKSHLKKGKNVIAIRTVEDWSNDAFFGASGDMWIQVGDQKINLEGTWKFNNRIEPPYPKVVRYEHSPGTLFNAMINPVAGYTINGAIWYQGESNVNKNQYYKDLFMALIDEWRVRWNQGPFPFMYVQLANYQQRYDNPTDSDWAKLQEAQAQTLTLANTGMATAIDIGDAEDIHPRNKQDVGLRLWLQAKHLVYGENIIYSGPMYRGHVIKENKVEVSFYHVGKGLMQKNFDELVGFALAGEDQKFYWADAVIEGDRVILSAPEVPQPVAIRYGWADNPAVALYNKEGLPAVPFRTDRW